jgi:hypothetical protein
MRPGAIHADGNQHWTRPGKASGTSATLKDRVFYVFSSNAAPLEAGRAYSPFALFAAFEHHKDFESAARALGQLSFGSQSAPAATAGLAIFPVAECRPCRNELSDPGHLPEHLFHVPGFISDVIQFTLANAPYPNIGLAFCGAVALQSFLAGRKVCTQGDLRTNIYLLALASSGTGKEFPRKVNSQVLYQIGLSISDRMTSSIHHRIRPNPSHVVTNSRSRSSDRIEVRVNPAQSVTHLRDGSVTDFREVKAHKYREKLSLFI